MRFVFRLISIVTALVLFGTASSDLFSQTKALKEINTSYPLGGSSSFFLGCLSFRFLRKTGFET